jgi:hypothetical protein
MGAPRIEHGFFASLQLRSATELTLALGDFPAQAPSNPRRFSLDHCANVSRLNRVPCGCCIERLGTWLEFAEEGIAREKVLAMKRREGALRA